MKRYPGTIALICGSPKQTGSSSAAVLDRLREKLPEKTPITDIHIAAKLTAENAELLKSCDTLLFAFPLYVDGIPGHLLRALMQLEPLMTSKQRVYGIINCGFFEGRQCQTAARILENWAARSSCNYMGAIGLGTGGMLTLFDKYGEGPLKPIETRLTALVADIISGQTIGFEHTQASLPKIVYKLAVEMNWRRSAKRNGLKSADLNRKPLPPSRQ